MKGKRIKHPINETMLCQTQRFISLDEMQDREMLYTIDNEESAKYEKVLDFLNAILHLPIIERESLFLQISGKTVRETELELGKVFRKSSKSSIDRKRKNGFNQLEKFAPEYAKNIQDLLRN